MSWAVGYNNNLQRDIGYGVPSYCDYPGCYEEIDRGLSYICGGLYYEEHGCGRVFCEEHLVEVKQDGDDYFSICERCRDGKKPFDPSPDTDEWIEHKMTDESWAKWRAKNGVDGLPVARTCTRKKPHVCRVNGPCNGWPKN